VSSTPTKPLRSPLTPFWTAFQNRRNGIYWVKSPPPPPHFVFFHKDPRSPEKFVPWKNPSLSGYPQSQYRAEFFRIFITVPPSSTRAAAVLNRNHYRSGFFFDRPQSFHPPFISGNLQAKTPPGIPEATRSYIFCRESIAEFRCLLDFTNPSGVHAVGFLFLPHRIHPGYRMSFEPGPA